MLASTITNQSAGDKPVLSTVTKLQSRIASLETKRDTAPSTKRAYYNARIHACQMLIESIGGAK